MIEELSDLAAHLQLALLLLYTATSFIIGVVKDLPLGTREPSDEPVSTTRVVQQFLAKSSRGFEPLSKHLLTKLTSQLDDIQRSWIEPSAFAQGIDNLGLGAIQHAGHVNPFTIVQHRYRYSQTRIREMS